MIFSRILAICLQLVGMISLSTEKEVVSPPVFSLQSGYYYTETKEDYSDGIVIAFNKREDDATIYYSIDETNSVYNEYTEPFVVNESTCVKAYAETNNGESKTVTVIYNLRTNVVPTIEGGIYSDKIFLKLKHNKCDCVEKGKTKVYYTLDGSSPKIDGILYTPDKGITIKKSCILTLMIVPDNGNTVTYKRIKYIINPSSEVEQYKEKYLYNTLSEQEKEIYQRLYTAAEQGKNALLADMKLTLNDTWTAVEAFFYENPQFLIDYYTIRVPHKYVTEVIFYGNEDYLEKRTKLNKIACNILGEIEDDELKMVYKIHDAIVRRVNYDMDADDKFNAGGAIIDNQAVCQGYAMAFTYLCQAAGIECITVKGETESGSHAWNMVKIDGKWYHLDVCWDDTELYDYDFFVFLKKKLTKHIN